MGGRLLKAFPFCVCGGEGGGLGEGEIEMSLWVPWLKKRNAFLWGLFVESKRLSGLQF